jgi:hypothetical protein
LLGEGAREDRIGRNDDSFPDTIEYEELDIMLRTWQAVGYEINYSLNPGGRVDLNIAEQDGITDWGWPRWRIAAVYVRKLRRHRKEMPWKRMTGSTKRR